MLPSMIGSNAIRRAQSAAGLKRRAFGKFPTVIYTGHAFILPDLERCVLSVVKIIGTKDTGSFRPTLFSTVS